jgi:tryptophan synthase beta chain
MAAYQSYFAGELTDYAYPEEAIKSAMEQLPVVEGI